MNDNGTVLVKYVDQIIWDIRKPMSFHKAHGLAAETMPYSKTDEDWESLKKCPDEAYVWEPSPDGYSWASFAKEQLQNKYGWPIVSCMVGIRRMHVSQMCETHAKDDVCEMCEEVEDDA
jgi:hypothetical protein